LYLVTGSSSGIGKAVYDNLKQTDMVTGIDILPSDIICDLSFDENIKTLILQLANLNKDIEGIVTSAGVIGGKNTIPVNYFGSVRIIEYLYQHYGKVNAVLVGSNIYTHAKTNNNLISLLLENKEKEAIDFAKNNQLTDTEVYASCKKALNFWMRLFIKNNKNSRINIVHPSLMKTGMTEQYVKSEIIKIIFSEDIDKAYIGGPEEVSGLICYLIKNSKAVNGQFILVDNGVYDHEAT